jgi:hypothetical protein
MMIWVAIHRSHQIPMLIDISFAFVEGFDPNLGLS